MVAEAKPRPLGFGKRFSLWARRIGLARKSAFALAFAAIASALGTYAVLSGSTPFGPEPETVLILLNVNLVLLLLLGAVVARRVVQVWAERRRGSAGSRLYIRLVVLFSLVAVTPAIVMAVFSALFFNFGLQSWFSERVRTALQESLAVAEAYLHEHQQNIGADVLAMANDLNREASALMLNPQRFQQVFSAQAALRELSEAIIFDESGRVLARAGFTFVLEFDRVPEWALEKARRGEVAIVTNERDDRVRALVQLDTMLGSYLYVGRYVEPRVLGHMERTAGAVEEYRRLEGQRSGMQITFAMIFVVVALLLLLAAVWVGLTFAAQLARPISSLISAAERVRAGDLSVRVGAAPTGDDLGVLSRAFNRMTSQLEAQRRELIEANRQLDMRRRFTETVLSGVSAGVVGLDAEGRINLPNRSASELLSVDLDALRGTMLSEVVPEMAPLLDQATRGGDRLVQSQINVTRAGPPRTLLIRIAAERHDDELRGFVITFDDITELLAAQRKAAWADVARRIAHEIKNPLTPIQLSAERLKRKYLKEIRSDPEIFVTCTDTIVRQVGDIGRMVDEFSAFARMPAPVLGWEDLAELCRQSIFLQKSAHPDIVFVAELPEQPLRLMCDRRQVSQALTNLLQNAVDAIHGREAPSEGGLPPGRVVLRGYAADGQGVLEVEDNGRGLPVEQRDRLTEPYVTTRTKGTGLGLAIVKKIMEDHGGNLVLEDGDRGGARVRLLFPTAAVDAPEPPPAPQMPEDMKPAIHGT